MKLLALIIPWLLTSTCTTKKKNPNTEFSTDSQIGEYVTSVFEDYKGHLWFGTIEKGIARYDGNELKYFTKENGLPTNRVTSVKQDSIGVYWFQTGEGISRYDGKKFTTYRVNDDDIGSNMISQFFIDSKGNCWVGTWSGVYLFDGQEFTSFELPTPQIETIINQDTKGWITEITEDRQGNIWFGRDGYGACKYDGQSFIHVLRKDGLHSNNITNIEFDDDGGIWFGTRVAEKDNPDPTRRTGKGGINRMVNDSITSFPIIPALNTSDVYGMYKDAVGNIWISSTTDGMYRYNGVSLDHYDIPISVMGILRDSKDQLWLAGAGGLYKIKQNGEVVNVTTAGPWN